MSDGQVNNHGFGLVGRSERQNVIDRIIELSEVLHLDDLITLKDASEYYAEKPRSLRLVHESFACMNQ